MKYLIVGIYDPEEAERTTADDLKVIVAGQRLIANQIELEGYEIPKDLQNSLEACDRELKHKLEADLRKELEGIRKRREAMATREERRQVLDAREAEILKQLDPKAAAATGSTP